MIYTALTKKALRISFDAHKNQTDQAGIPYVYHPYEVASHMDDEYSTCIALLHDVIEDAGITPDYLRQEGFPEEVIQAILCMTHNKELPYLDYIRIIRKNPLATKVKLADLEHNSNLSRIDTTSPKDYERVEKYRKARAILLGEDNT